MTWSFWEDHRNSIWRIQGVSWNLCFVYFIIVHVLWSIWILKRIDNIDLKIKLQFQKIQQNGPNKVIATNCVNKWSKHWNDLKYFFYIWKIMCTSWILHFKKDVYDILLFLVCLDSLMFQDSTVNSKVVWVLDLFQLL